MPVNIPLHSRLIAALKADVPIHTHPPAVPVNLILVCVKIHLIDAQIIYAEGMKNVIAPLFKLTNQVAPP